MYKTIVQNDYAIGIGAYTKVYGDESVSIGRDSKIGTDNSLTRDAVALGAYANVGGNANNAVALGYRSSVSGNATNAIALGSSSKAVKENGIAIGGQSASEAAASIAIGQGTKVKTDKSVAVGNGNTVTGENVFVLGNNVAANVGNSVYLGAASQAVADASGSTGGSTGTVQNTNVNTLLFGDYAGAKADGAITVGAAGKERRIQNVAAGLVTADSTDAINGSQLYATQSLLNVFTGSVADVLGGNASLNPDGSLQPPAYSIINGTPATGSASDVRNVGEALSRLNTAVLSPLTFSGDTAGTNGTNQFERKLGSEIKIIGGVNDATSLTDNNIGVVSDGTDTLNIRLSQTLSGLKRTSLSDDEGHTTEITGNGVVISGNDQNAVKLSNTGLDNGGNKILNVTSGLDGQSLKDATGDTLNNAANIFDLKTAIDETNTALTNAGFGLIGDDGKSVQKTLGDKISITGGKNITTSVTDDGKLAVTLNDNLDLGKNGTVTLGNALLNDSGLTLSGGPSVTVDGINAGSKTITNVADGTDPKDAVNVSQLDAVKETANKGWNLQANGDTVSKVAPGDKVQFINGTNIDITRNGNDLTIATTSELSADTLVIRNGGPAIGGNGITMGDKKITGLADGTDPKDAANVGQLNAVKETANKGWNLTANGADSTVVAPGEAVDLSPATGDSNIVIGKTERNLTVGLSRNLNIDSVQAGDTLLNGDGLVIADGPAIKKSGIDAAGKKIANVANGTEATDVVNLSQLTAAAGAAATEVAAGTNIVSVAKTEGANGQAIYTVNAKGSAVAGGSDKVVITPTTDDATNLTTYGVDLSEAAKGSLAKADSALQDIVTQIDGNDVKTANGADNKVNFASGDNIALVNDNGAIKVNVKPDLAVDSLQIRNGGPAIDGNGIAMGDKKLTGLADGTDPKDAVNVSQLDAVKETANKGWNLQANGDAASKVAAGDTVQLLDGQNIKVTRNGNDLTIATAANLTADSLTIGNDGPMISGAGIDMMDKKLTNVAPGALSADSKDGVNGSQLFAVGNSTAAALGGGSTFNPDTGVVTPSINVGDKTFTSVNDALGDLNTMLTATTADVSKGWNLTANGTDSTKVAAGETVDLSPATGDNNIVIGKTDRNLTVGLNRNLGLDSVQVGDTLLNADGLVITDGPSVKKSGIDAAGKKIANVANGTEGTDAVNLSQLTAAAGAAATEVAAGTNIASVAKTEGANGQAIYTVNANGAVVAGGSDKVVITPTTDDTTNLTTYGVDLSDAAKASLAKADSALQSIVTQIDGTDVKTLNGSDNKLQFATGDNITLTNDNGAIKVGTTPDLTADRLAINNGGPVISGAGIDMTDKKLTNVAPGALSADSKDGVNGSQLFAVGNSTAAALGGGSTFNPDTGVVTPSINVGDKTFTSVNDALGDLNTMLTATTAEVSKGWNLQANGDAASKVAAGDTVQLLDGQNIKVTRNGNDLTIATAANLTADSLTIGNDGPMISGAGIDMKGKKLTNVAPGALSADSKDGVNGSQLFALGDSAAAALGGDSAFDPVTGQVTAGLKVGDKTFKSVNGALTAINDNVNYVANRGWDIGGANGIIGKVASGGQVQFLAGDNHTKVDVAQENGISKVTVSTAASPLQYSDTANANGQNAPASSFEKTNSVTLVGKDAAAPVSLNNVAKATLSEDSLQAVNGQQLYGLGNSIATTLGGGTYFDPNTGTLSTKIRVDGNTYNSVADALDGIGKVASGGWHLQLNNDAPQKVGSGATVGFNQGRNIELTRDGNQITIATAPNVTFDSVKAGSIEGDTVSAKSYLGVVDGPALTPDGIDAAGKPITNVKPGEISEHSTDVVTGAQLHGLASGAAAAINHLQGNIDRVAKDADAGSATAGAMANLPQAYLPGKSMFALGTARYGSQQGFAAGLSTVSENGKWIIKGSVSGNTRGKTMFGAGIGYQW